MSLREITAEMITKNGPISFHDFMEMALYFPGLGYYSSPSEKFGKKGDYYTSPCLTPVFGEMIGKQIEEMWRFTGEKKFTIVEFGGGNGFLCYDILHYFKFNTNFYNNLNYYIIEKSTSLRNKSKRVLDEKVHWLDSIEEISNINGCILSNEVVDNFAVHQVVMKDELMEVFVDYNNEEFVEKFKPASLEIKNYMNELDINLPKGFRTEINLEAVSWIKQIAKALQKGFVLTIDYGYPQSQLYNSARSTGTLLCYNKHTINYNPYKNMGEQDITAHVNFSALAY
ncbi:MAG: class I SAM-dependent methyltransferase, partial [Ginsengibacter sp.]